MTSFNLEKMDVESLIALRAEIESTLAERVKDLQKQLAQLGGARGRASAGGRSNSLKGIKVAPKYRGPDGETWAGRGARPRWLVALIDAGHHLAEFAIDGDGAATAAAAEQPAPKKQGRKPAGRKRRR